MLEDFDLLKIHTEKKDPGRMHSSKSAPHLSIQEFVIGSCRFPTHPP
jgi:hypothetical protein